MPTWLAAVLESIGATVVVTLVGLLWRQRVRINREKQAYGKLKADADKALSDFQAATEQRIAELLHLRSENKSLWERCTTIEARLPDEVFKNAKKDWDAGQLNRANVTVMDWIDREGDAVSQLFLLHSMWLACFQDDDALAAAEWYVSAARILWPENAAAWIFWNDLTKYLSGTRQPPTILARPLQIEAIIAWNDPRRTTERVDLAMAAGLEEEAKRRWYIGHYTLALLAVTMALSLRRAACNKPSPAILKAEQLQIRILGRLGRWMDALILARSNAEASVSTCGPNHPDALNSQFELARALFNVDDCDEALSLAKGVKLAQAAHIGPYHLDTLCTRHLISDILFNMAGRQDEALETAKDLELDYVAHFGPCHADTLSTRFLVIKIMATLNVNEDVLNNVGALVRDYVTNSDFGASHSQTLASRFQEARILHLLDHNEKALQAALAVEHDYKCNPDLGASYFETLRSGKLVADILDALGRSQEALAKAEVVEEEQLKNPNLGAHHFDTMETARLVLKIRSRFHQE